EKLGIAKHKTPEFDIIAVDGAATLAAGLHKFGELKKSLASAIRIDAALFRFVNAEGTEAGDLERVDVEAFLLCAESIRERALTFRTPHDAIDVVGPGPVFDNAEKKIPVVRVVEADSVGVVA